MEVGDKDDSLTWKGTYTGGVSEVEGTHCRTFQPDIESTDGKLIHKFSKSLMMGMGVQYIIEKLSSVNSSKKRNNDETKKTCCLCQKFVSQNAMPCRKHILCGESPDRISLWVLWQRL